ncbi:zinc finger protein 334-like isoform X2 [Colias croceus]|uniref:zinc finger protein 334-like isoform X2 n=1 Tax=Colias crocea TaxID=72248 RepID=UPI001E27D582|nr:zinc finger protein 334-like isoform X2 [Colias croceus]
MASLNICRICLRTDMKMYNYDQYLLKSHYEEVMHLKLKEEDALPRCFCYECASLLQKFHKFKEKCFKGKKVLEDILCRGSITYEAVDVLDRAYLKLSHLGYSHDRWGTTNNVEDIKIIVPKREVTTDTQDLDLDNIIPVNKVEIFTDYENFTDNESITDYESDFFEQMKTDNKNIADNKKSTDCKNIAHIEFDLPVKMKTDTKNIKGCKKSTDNELNISQRMETDDIDSDIEDNKERVKIKLVRKKKKKMVNKKCGATKISFIYESDNWRIITLTEEEAMKEFKLRGEERKYILAPYKCTDCLKGFPRKDNYIRHVEYVHRESKGKLVCNFCKARFRFPCYIRNHMKDHYTKYECARCPVVCMTEQSALHHEDSHSGQVKKCKHCNVEFRHSSTFYTHLRTHRSDHVCTSCGESFVSEIGLKQHRSAKHRSNTDNFDDEDENTFCIRCDKNFDTRKAYEEHFIHSVLHADEGIDDSQPKNVIRKQILEKVKGAISSSDTGAIRKPIRKPNTGEANRKWMGFRRKRKPTTCHQCGKFFATQNECLKHHYKEHPRTSFFSPSERHICEICGASLAPGSIKAHHNSHTKQILHTCNICGRQFAASVSYKRHLLTHTGEKPYPCTQCGKRFTQSNSLKLHYNTVHLKQPHPKRNRRKKKEELEITVEDPDKIKKPRMEVLNSLWCS